MKLYTNECLYKDVYTIIKMMPLEMRNKINKDFIEFLKENLDDEFEGTINPEIPLKEQQIKEDIKIMLSLIYISYFCDKQKQKELLELDEKNINDFYNKDIFNNNEKEDDYIEQSQEMSLIEYKESFIKRIFNKIKNFFIR